jgi:hypothetical protein
MTDPDVEREIEANRARDEAARREAEDDGPIIDTAERVLDPLVDPLVDDALDRDVDADEAERFRRQNDEAQRPD